MNVTFRQAKIDDLSTIVHMLADDFLGQQRERLEDPLPESYVWAFREIEGDPNNELIVAVLSSPPYEGGVAEGWGGSLQDSEGSSEGNVENFAASREPPRHPAEKRGLPPNSPPGLRRGGRRPGWSDKEGSLHDDDPEEWEEGDFEKPVWLEDEDDTRWQQENHPVAPTTPSAEAAATPLPAGRELTPPPLLRNEESRVCVYDLKRGFDGYGREIYIQAEDAHTGKPKVWYKFDRQGRKVRSERSPSGISVQHLNASPFL